MKTLNGGKALVVFDDYFRPGNPAIWVTRASAFLPEALDCGAGIYSVDARGVSPVVPFGDASTSEFAGGFSAHPGPLLMDQIAGETFALGQQQGELRSLAYLTGGQFEGGNDANGAFQKLVSDLRSTYMIGYYVKDLRQDGKFHRIKIDLRRHGIRIRAKAGYFASVEYSKKDEVQSDRDRSRQ